MVINYPNQIVNLHDNFFTANEYFFFTVKRNLAIHYNLILGALNAALIFSANSIATLLSKKNSASTLLNSPQFHSHTWVMNFNFFLPNTLIAFPILNFNFFKNQSKTINIKALDRTYLLSLLSLSFVPNTTSKYSLIYKN